MMNMEKQTALATPFDHLGGESRVQVLVERFYDLMDLEPGFAQLRRTHAPALDDARQKLFWFRVAGWAARSITPSVLATRVCVRATCLSKSA